MHGLREAFQVEQVALQECELRMEQSTRQEPLLSGRKVIEPDHAVTLSKKAIHHVAADKAGRARN